MLSVRPGRAVRCRIANGAAAIRGIGTMGAWGE
jgi:hypothetical protein